MNSAPPAFYPPQFIPQGDNSYLVKPGKILPWISPAQAARLTGLSISTIYRLIDEGRLECDRPSPRRIRIFASSLHQHLENCRDPEFWRS